MAKMQKYPELYFHDNKGYGKNIKRNIFLYQKHK